MPDATDALPLPPTPSPEGQPHVYVINTDSAFLEMIADLLEDTHARITLEQMRPNIEVTIANLCGAQPDVLLLDVLPLHDGAPLLLERLEGEARLDGLPVILASTSPNLAEQLAGAHGARVVGVLPKPFDLDSFYLLLHRVVRGLRVP
jgi:CheY-like chemotaxis protein